MKQQRKFVAVAVAAVLGGGCAVKSPAAPRQDAQLVVEQAARDVSPQLASRIKRNDSVVFERAAVVPATPVVVPDNPVDVDIKNLPVRDLIDALAKENNWSVHWSDETVQDAPIDLRLLNVDFHTAISEAAGMTNHVAVFDDALRRVTIARKATWTLRFPGRLAETLKWDYSVGGNPSSGGGEDSIAESLDSTSLISGGIEQNLDVVQFVENAINDSNNADERGRVQYAPSLGVLIVHGTYRQLHRAEAVVTRLLREATTRVELRVAIVEMQLDSNSEIGIDLEKMFGDLPNTESIAVAGRDILSPSFRGSVTRRSLSYVLDVLRSNTNLNVVTRPNLVVDNHTPADIFDGSVLPYLASVDVEIDDGGNASYSAESASAADGVKLSVLPHVLSDTQLQLRLLPVLSGVPSFETFSYGDAGGSLTLPLQQSKQALLSVTLSDGETLILAGNRVSTRAAGSSGLPGVSTPLTDSQWGREQSSELAIIVNVNIVPPPYIDVVVERAL